MLEPQQFDFIDTLEYKVIYIMTINDASHLGCVKIGQTTLNSSKQPDELIANCDELKTVARKRIDEYTKTAAISYDLLHTELAIKKTNQGLVAFRDYDVHQVLQRSGFNKVKLKKDASNSEWFRCDLKTAIAAIQACKQNQSSLDKNHCIVAKDPVRFRDEQEQAIQKALKTFKKSDRMLWNAKMRFGKTLCALELIKRNPEFKKVIIITNRPVVKDSWFEDFHKIFTDDVTTHAYGSKTFGLNYHDILKTDKNIVYFASLQDLKGSAAVVKNKKDKNDELFAIDWDLLVIDEAHEGTLTELGQNVIKLLAKPEQNKPKKTKILELSGTPFNLLDGYESHEIFTWDYIAEQSAKYIWNQNNFGKTNPYEDLPKMHIYTYHLANKFTSYLDLEDKAFSFKEFFRTKTLEEANDHNLSGLDVGDFVHKADVNRFLNLIVDNRETDNFPFSKDKYREYFRHTLWVLPGVKEAKALVALMRSHPVFLQFEIINVAGAGDEEIDPNQALKTLREKMTESPEDTRTITVTCGRLTTGVTVPAWTAVLMLSGGYSTKTSQYMQTIFRVQSPANIGGKTKQNAYVFDFAPDRALKMIADFVDYSNLSDQKMAFKSPMASETRLQEFLNYCPVISLSNSMMREYNVNQLMQELKKAYIDKVVRSGFDSLKLYSDELFKLSSSDLEKFLDLKQYTKHLLPKNKNTYIINREGFDGNQANYDLISKQILTKNDESNKAIIKEELKNRQFAISILKAISIRIPLLFFGSNLKFETITSVDDFADLIDDVSWKEFMPDGITKAKFKDLAKYYDRDIFIGAGQSIQQLAKAADHLEPLARIQRIIEIFKTFKNPDRETVLTPWSVVNLHLKTTIGGYSFFDENAFDHEQDQPVFVDQGLFSKQTVLNPHAKFLEINSKSGLYMLYVAYSLYALKTSALNTTDCSLEAKYELWDEIISNNLFIISKSPMASQITTRTLVGYRSVKINIHAFDDLISQMQHKKDKLVKKLTNPEFWKKKGTAIKFDAVIGNPPYQGINHQQIYPHFYLTSLKLGKIVSLIFPVGWQEPKSANGLSEINRLEIKADKQIVYIDKYQGIFKNIAGVEWVNIVLWQNGYDNGLSGKQLIKIHGKNHDVKKLLCNQNEIEKPQEIIDLAEIVGNTPGFISLQKFTSSLKPYGLRTDVIGNEAKYGLQTMDLNRKKDDDLIVVGKKGSKLIFRYIRLDCHQIKATKTRDKYKVFVPYAWGAMNEAVGLGGGLLKFTLLNQNKSVPKLF